MNDLSSGFKLCIQLFVFIVLFTISILSYIPTIEYIDNLFKLEFSETMFLFGFFLGLLYWLFLYLRFISTKSKNTLFRYITAIMPSTFMINVFIWYFYTFFNKLFSEYKEDINYYQTVIISFSICFIMTKISKEYRELYSIYKKH